MCGIVAYFGSAPDSVARMVTGMSAIIYRAPDSTGMGMFGNISNPILQRKNLGSVAGFLEVIKTAPFNENPDKALYQLWQGPLMSRSDMQKQLIEFEGLSTEIHAKCRSGSLPYPLISELFSGDSSCFVSLSPGYPGRSGPMPYFKVTSRNDLRSVVKTMACEYNLSFVAIKSVFRNLLEDNLKKYGEALLVKADAADVFNVFDYLFQKIFEEFRYRQPVRQSYKRIAINPHARKYLWYLLRKMDITIPEDFDCDAVSCLFRLLDAALVSRIPHYAVIESELQGLLDDAIAYSGVSLSMPWKSLYLAEKGLNVYGRAAAAVLEWLQKKELLKELSSSVYAGTSSAFSSLFGVTGNRCLDYIIQPVIAQGRWALQSSVTLKNAHPFMDEEAKRSIVLNGQFSSEMEHELADFLSSVAGLSFRSENSSEYFALLWGYYYKILKQEKARFQEVKDQIEKGLEVYAVGSNSINYQIFRQVKNKSDTELDEAAFIEAAKIFTRNGGQIAAAGISIKSPRTLYAVSCNRPLFIVKKKYTNDFMVVSDINAAMGLFHQSDIIDVTMAYEGLIKEMEELLLSLKHSRAPQKDMQAVEEKYAKKIDDVLTRFAVDMYTLEGDDIFAKIFTCFKNGNLLRDIHITNFKGERLHNIEPDSINLTPPHVYKDLEKSFFESHLEEVPDLLEKMLSARMQEDGYFNRFPFRINLLHRKFGKKLKSLERIFLFGMGSSNYVSLFSAGFTRAIVSRFQVICLEPVEIDMLTRLIEPERDLVLLISWSATTAEMVKTAKALSAMRVVFAAVTEKTFGDMALIARKSCGIIHVMSGEEVTVSAVKSTFCSLMAIDLFMLWLCTEILDLPVDLTVSGSIRQIPGVLGYMLQDAKIKSKVQQLAFYNASADMFLVVDALYNNGTGYEAAMKMEELTWSVKSRAVDYRDFELNMLTWNKDRNFLIVNATHRERILEAIEVMTCLNKADIPFFAVTYEGSRTETIQTLSKNNLILLPSFEHGLQPFVDLVFYYLLAFYSSMAQGRKADDYPRNRAKSVTTSRSIAPPEFSPAGELFNVRHREQLLFDFLITDTDYHAPIKWESYAGFKESTRTYFQLNRKLAQKISNDNPLPLFVDFDKKMLSKLSLSLFDSQNDFELLFLPLDITADAAVRNTVAKLYRLLPCRMRALRLNESVDAVKGDVIIAAVSSFDLQAGFLSRLNKDQDNQMLWFGPEQALKEMPIKEFSLGKYMLTPEFEGISGSALYAALTLMLLKAWSFSEPEKAVDLEKYFKRSGHIIISILNHSGLAEDIQRVMGLNSAYRTLLYLSPPDGSGISFTRKFDKTGRIISKNLPFGSGAHGALVTVDNRVDTKFVALKDRNTMITLYGKSQVKEWETIYLRGENIESYLETLTNDLSSRVESPFFAEGQWYLPLLKPEYDAREDNLIVVDASSERYFDQAADDLAVFGCRHARMIVITQQAFMGMPEKNAILKFPLAGMLEIPAVKTNDQLIPLSDLHIPFAVNIVAAAMAGLESE
ncbi:MAG: hypothetical protein U9P10_14620 [Thermodesulfobacteriota bacterium]|nr:hypothetical protein [Thermodesulfobacteriota bacterium]